MVYWQESENKNNLHTIWTNKKIPLRQDDVVFTNSTHVQRVVGFQWAFARARPQLNRSTIGKLSFDFHSSETFFPFHPHLFFFFFFISSDWICYKKVNDDELWGWKKNKIQDNIELFQQFGKIFLPERGTFKILLPERGKESDDSFVRENLLAIPKGIAITKTSIAYYCGIFCRKNKISLYQWKYFCLFCENLLAS